MTTQKKSYYISCLILFLSITISACVPRVTQHGYILSNEEIKIIKNTKLNKSEILEILGQPSSKTTFSDNIWYYITQVRRERAYFEVNNTSTNVIAIKFDKNQEVKSYKIYNEKDSFEVTINWDKTMTVHEKDENFIKEFFSSFMRRLAEPNLPLSQ